MGMLQQVKAFGFPQEAFAENTLFAGIMFFHDLQSEQLFQKQMFRFVDLAHASCAEK